MLFRKAHTVILSFAVASVASFGAVAADTTIKEGLKLGEKRKYDEAIVKVLEGMPSYNDQEKANANLILGLMSVRAAELYQSFFRLNVESLSDAYELFGKEKKQFRSTYLPFYQTELAVETGNCKKVSSALNSHASDKSLGAEHNALAVVMQAECLFMEKNYAGGEAKLKAVGKGSVAIDVEKLAAVARFGKKSDSLSADWKKLEAKLASEKSPRIASKGVAIYTALGEYENAISFMTKFDLSRPDFEEASKGKSVFFYDASLMRNIGEMYLGAARHFLGKVTNHEKVGGQAKMYLAQSYLLDNGDVANAAKAAINPEDPGFSPKTKPLASIYKIAIDDFQASKKIVGAKMVAGFEQQLDVLAEGLRICRMLGQGCDDLLEIGKKNGGESFGAKFVNLNRGMGELYLAKNKVDMALKYLEYARDKSNKNKIESNDPMLLVTLADGYRRVKSYNESLEILFEFAKHYPAVRQAQEALQSIYSVEHKSAGDVRIF